MSTASSGSGNAPVHGNYNNDSTTWAPSSQQPGQVAPIDTTATPFQFPTQLLRSEQARISLIQLGVLVVMKLQYSYYSMGSYRLRMVWCCAGLNWT